MDGHGLGAHGPVPSAYDNDRQCLANERLQV
jgi:hypothetical protein